MAGDASEFFKLGVDLTRAPGKMVHGLKPVFAEAGVATAREWARIARVTAGVHGKWYPDSIDSEVSFTLTGDIDVEVGPNRGKKQGAMGRGFEFGSVNQPPHLDGVKAFDIMEPRVEKMVDAAMVDLIP